MPGKTGPNMANPAMNKMMKKMMPQRKGKWLEYHFLNLNLVERVEIVCYDTQIVFTCSINNKEVRYEFTNEEDANELFYKFNRLGFHTSQKSLTGLSFNQENSFKLYRKY
jgi:hypothetical protein